MSGVPAVAWMLATSVAGGCAGVALSRVALRRRLRLGRAVAWPADLIDSPWLFSCTSCGCAAGSLRDVQLRLLAARPAVEWTAERCARSLCGCHVSTVGPSVFVPPLAGWWAA